MAEEEALSQLCRLYGIEPVLHDLDGNAHPVGNDVLRALLGAMRVAAAEDEQVRASLAARTAQIWSEITPPVVVVAADAPMRIVLRLPIDRDAQSLRWRLDEERGTYHEGACEPGGLEELERWQGDGGICVARCLTLDARPPPGYHRFTLSASTGVLGRTQIVVAPRTCYLPLAVQRDGRVFGPMARLYALRSQRDWGIGDFTDLRVLLETWSERGAGIVELNPVHAVLTHDPRRISPIRPSSRLFVSALYLDPAQIEEFHESAEAQRLVAAGEFVGRVGGLQAAELVDYFDVAAIKMQVLELLYATFRSAQLDASSARVQEWNDFRAREGERLRHHGLFEALQEHFARTDATAWGWPAWPEPYRDPRAEAVAQFCCEHLVRVEFYEWLQWQCDRQLHGVGLRAFELGLGVGLYGGLAVSSDRGGAEEWANQDLYAAGAVLGAPPDRDNPDGQNWGLAAPVPEQMRRTAYAQFIAALRANMRHVGALRIDCITALLRLYWIADGLPGRQGAYVRYPLHDLLGILALESQRNQCMVVGDHLDHAPDEMRRAMHDYGVLPHRVLYCERREDGEFKAPTDYSATALAATGTHDLPTLAGFWSGRDLQLRQELGLFPSAQAHQQAVLERAQDRARLLVALQRQGLLPESASLDPAGNPQLTPELVDAVYTYLARTPCKVLMVRLDDILGVADPVSLPGTNDRYPNWQGRLPLELERWRDDARFLGVTATIEAQRPRWEGQRPKPAPPTVPAARIPLATYRLQLHAGFGFRDATALVPYLAALGVSHVYCSPYLRARPGSTHGYDIIDHNALNPEIGTPAQFEQFVQTLQAHGMGQILDLVPNHMGVMGADNRWWMDVLENGPASAYADFFDIDWEHLDATAHRKVMVPVLGDHYGVALERGEIKLTFEAEAGGFALFYFQHRFPVAPREYARILEMASQALPAEALEATARAEFESLISAFTHLPPREATRPDLVTERNRDKEVHKRRLAALCRAHPALLAAIDTAAQDINGTPGEPRSFDTLHLLLEAQAYRLAYWRVASDEINFRRFFDINDLAGLRVENEAVFEATHRLVLELIADGKVQGLRIDHPDGLYEPARYFRRLQDRVAVLRGAVHGQGRHTRALPIYLVVEKIAASHERVPESWPVHGTTGYRFANVVNGVFVDTAARSRIDRIYRAFTGGSATFDDVVYTSKRVILRNALSSELNVLANQLARIARADRRTRDFTLNTLRQALTEVIACFPVYRTYIAEHVSAQDRRYVEWAVARAKRRSQASDVSIFDFVLSALLDRAAQGADEKVAQQVHRFALRFQQLTAPVTAKGMEDTAFYRYNRLVSLNEVGGDPERFGFTLAAFHGASLDRSRRWPHTMLAGSTHDSKRSEDVRARINTLSEMPAAWRLALRRWSRINRSKKVAVDDVPAPSPNDEYLLYQTLLGSWPVTPMDEAALAAYRERIESYMLKAVREAKVHSSWVNINEPYEHAVREFVRGLLARLQGNLFLDDFLGLQRLVAWLGMLNSLSQTLIRLASPGVPDIFQGTELWDDSLVDPDNRRPVDWDLRRRLLDQIKPLVTLPTAQRVPQLEAMLLQPEDGRSKLFVICAGLAARARHQSIFERGDYVAVTAAGLHAKRVIAFARRGPSGGAIALAPRLLAAVCDRPGVLPCGVQAWQDTHLPLPWLAPGTELRDLISGRSVLGTGDTHGTRLGMGEVLSAFPVALLEYTAEPGK